ncbi:uncharacterized protein [Montipora foliosa]|uniref:uncharacterized protein n=1 Tax=Montipora foliosa TaxID=591990 RepID=UPI0035F21599
MSKKNVHMKPGLSIVLLLYVPFLVLQRTRCLYIGPVVRFWCPQSLAMKLTRKASSSYCVSLMTLLVSYGVIAEDCHKPLGLADGRIKDDQLDASSVYNNNSQLYGPALARLNRTGGYRANPRAHNPFFLSVQFQKAMIVTGIATQGYFDNKIQEWTRRYMLAYLFGSDVKYFKKRNRDDNEQFDGNFDNDTIVRHYVPWPVKLTFIYVIPMEWKNNFAIRMELYGCTAAGNECESFPCQNGTCWQKTGGYQCNCTNGFNGTHCEININECSSNPCRPNGTWTDYVNSFTCSCPVGFGGSTCDEVGQGLLTWEELSEVILDIEVAMNNRPLCYVEDDVQLPTLTPNVFLMLTPVFCPSCSPIT